MTKRTSWLVSIFLVLAGLTFLDWLIFVIGWLWMIVNFTRSNWVRRWWNG